MMKEKYDGWVMKHKNGTTRPEMFSEKRTDCIEKFTARSMFTWRQCQEMGWSCVRVELVEVEQ